MYQAPFLSSDKQLTLVSTAVRCVPSTPGEPLVIPTWFPGGHAPSPSSSGLPRGDSTPPQPVYTPSWWALNPAFLVQAHGHLCGPCPPRVSLWEMWRPHTGTLCVWAWLESVGTPNSTTMAAGCPWLVSDGWMGSQKPGVHWRNVVRTLATESRVLQPNGACLQFTAQTRSQISRHECHSLQKRRRKHMSSFWASAFSSIKWR